MKKGLSLLLVLAMVLTTMFAMTVPAFAADNALIISIGGQPTTLDPQYTAGADGTVYLGALFEGLFTTDQEGALVPAAVESYTVSDDSLVYTFTLRDNKWSDGEPVTADNFVYGFQRLVDPNGSNFYAYDYGVYIKNGKACADGDLPLDDLGVKALDDKTLEVTLEDICPYILEVLTYCSFFPARRDKAVNGDEGRWSISVDALVSNGPMKLVEMNEDHYMVFAKADTYWNKDAIKLEGLKCMFLEDPNAALGAFRAGQIDFTNMVTDEEIPMLKDMGVYHQRAALGTYFLMINNSKAPFDNADIRKAFALCIDNNYIAKTIMNGRFFAADAFIGPGFAGAVEGVDFHDETGVLIVDNSNMEANYEAARKLLSDAGFPDGAGLPTIEYAFNSSPIHQAIAEYAQYTWEKELGATVILAPVEGAAYGSVKQTGAFNIARQGWFADYNEPLNMLGIFTKNSGINEGRYDNPKFDELYYKAAVTADRAERFAIIHQMEELLVLEDQGTYPVMHYTNPYVYDDKIVTGLDFTSMGALILTGVVVVK